MIAAAGLVSSTTCDRTDRSNVIWRRRLCLDCGNRWTTFEIDAAEYNRMQKIESTRREITNFTATLNEAIARDFTGN